MNQNNEDIDLIELFLILWNGKLVIISFIVFALLSGSAYIFVRDYVSSKDQIFNSIIKYEINPIAIYKFNDSSYRYNDSKVKSDFKKLLYSKEIFSDWKNNVMNSSINYEDISNTKTIDEITVSKREEELLILFQDTNYFSSIILKTNQLILLDEIYSYIVHVNGVLSSRYLLSFKDEYNKIEIKNREFNNNFPGVASRSYIHRLILIEQYLAQIEGGQKIINLQPPTKPEKVNQNVTSKYVLLSGFAILGSMLGAFFLLTRRAFKRRDKLIA